MRLENPQEYLALTIVLYLGIQIRLGLSISFRLQKRTITDMKY